MAKKKNAKSLGKLFGGLLAADRKFHGSLLAAHDSVVEALSLREKTRKTARNVRGRTTLKHFDELVDSLVDATDSNLSDTLDAAKKKLSTMESLLKRLDRAANDFIQ